MLKLIKNGHTAWFCAPIWKAQQQGSSSNGPLNLQNQMGIIGSDESNLLRHSHTVCFPWICVYSLGQKPNQIILQLFLSLWMSFCLHIQTCLPEGYDVVDGTSLLNDDMIEDDDGASSSAYAELERLERETAAARSHHSTSSTVTAISVPPATPPSYRVPSASPISTSEPPVPQAIQAFKESANMVAAFNMQWKDEISAMRYELAELRRDVCGELKTFNSNFFNFTQCYNMWTLCREPCSDSTTQTDDRVSVGIQAGSSWSIRQNTEDKSVMCQPEPTPFSIMDLMDPPRIEIIEGTPESTPEGSGSPASPLPIEDFPWEINKKQKANKQPDISGHTGGHRSASLELWSRKYTSGPMSYLSMSF